MHGKHVTVSRCPHLSTSRPRNFRLFQSTTSIYEICRSVVWQNMKAGSQGQFSKPKKKSPKVCVSSSRRHTGAAMHTQCGQQIASRRQGALSTHVMPRHLAAGRGHQGHREREGAGSLWREEQSKSRVGIFTSAVLLSSDVRRPRPHFVNLQMRPAVCRQTP